MNSNKTPSSFFPRTCTHITHSFNKKGELRTALITGGDRLLILKDGFTLAESGSLFQPPYTTGNSGSLTPRVFHLCICPFVFFSIRVVVSTTAGIFLFELEDADVVWQSDAAAASSVLFGSALVNSNSSTCGASLQGRRLHLSTPEEKVKVSSVSYSVSSSAKSRRERDGDSTIGPLVEVGLHATRAEVITAEFITDVSLCIVFNDEVVIVTLHGGGGSPPSKGGIVDRVVWRSMGSYSRLAVCQYNRSIALALRSSTVAVFPCKCRQMSEEDGDVAGFSRAGGAARSETHPLFSPVTSVVNTTLFNASHPNTTEVWGREGPHWEIATRGIAASLGSYKVDQLEWHRASAHTLLCVTCTHIRDEKVQCLALYTVQSLTSVASFSNVHLDQQDCPLMGEESVKNKKSVSRTQLVLSGTIPLYDPHSPPAAVFTSIVSLFAHSSANLSSLNKQLDFLHIEKTDGTVRSSSFRFGNQKHASFAKLRAKGLSCPQLLAPLLEMYGPLSQVTVLPSWVNRPVELGKVSPYAEEIVRAHRYRVVCTFDTGLRCVVMLDLSSGVYRTECFLTLGAYRLTSLTSFDFPSNASVFDTDMNTEKLLAGLLMPPAPPTSSSDPACYVGIVLFAQRRSNDGFATSILTVAPFKEPLLLSNDVPLAQEEEEVLSGIEKVEFFYAAKVPR
ncbi:hypothetical protein AGDE_14419 [Angomonas deanei]|uniref:Uncharacterized protein n=1 Tax=Angomonas deanei TaxID=59799 RepID=A0A7G2CQT7_9TRYP|nr:hypothetical protein AGDE_14419 [Angomonas deanei]CAD2222130.1 hypothetical protein, conserved [Angomonas deanei]|eukprot:EPY20897.1 hypothetical protein AGDE_14419 [Angomonas deanei]